MIVPRHVASLLFARDRISARADVRFPLLFTRVLPRTLIVILLAIACGLPRPAAADVTGEQVKRAITQGTRAIKRIQNDDGTWPERHYAGGETCLATLALLLSGEAVDSPAVAKALPQIVRLQNQQVYVVALKIMVLAQADPTRFRREILAAARWLADAQFESGVWGYTQAAGPFDNSNTQFALLGLHTAAQAGVPVPGGVWQRARARVLALQNKDGGWSYRNDPTSYGSMTAAGVCNLIILGSSVAAPQEKGWNDGAAPNCGRYLGSRPLQNGLTWLGRNFRVDENPGRGANWQLYWLYATERAGILSGRRFIGTHDWYREGATHLVASQRDDGYWGTGLADTCFGVLFLAKGHKPLLVQKLQWSEDEDWNPDRHDLENLISYIGNTFGEPTAWQTVAFDAPLEEWLTAPLLYVQGHVFPTWSLKQCEKVRKYVEQGGTIFFEACCSRDDFRTGMERFARATFPDAPLRELDAGHPVYSAHHSLKPSGLRGIDIGCRTSVLYSPRDISCLWEQGKIPMLSEDAFKLGTNIAAFALGRSALRDRLDVVVLPGNPERAAGRPPVTEGALRLAQVVYDGDWRPDPQALVHLAEALRDTAQIDVVTEYATPKLDEHALTQHPILFMTGHYGFSLRDAERAALASHLRRGGFLLAEACCGRKAFDESFRKLAADLIPGQTLKKLPLDHPIFRGEPGFRIARIGYKEAALAERPDLTTSELWGIEIEGRLAVVYSPYSLGCSLDGHKCFDCRGVIEADAKQLAVNAVLYALSR
ncbi:MAG: DUF4159 domain-containing protein [Planctomycetes bacterium]|nr:DUF4159 domain-containing protein [Planctomycetota bacterium]